MRDLRRAIAEIISKKEGKTTTIPQYWIVDTEEHNALAFIYPSKSKYFARWLSRKLQQKGYAIVKPTIIIHSSGLDDSLQFIQITVRKLETCGGTV